MSVKSWSLIGLVVIVLVVLSSSLFTVQQTQQVLITQFGRPVRIITKPGLHTKIPFVQGVIPFDRRLLNYELPSEEVILGDQQRLVVDGFARFRITDPLRYYQSVGPSMEAIDARLGSTLGSSFRQVLGQETLPNVLSAARNRIMSQIQTAVNTTMQGFGITIEDVRIRRADLPEANTLAVLKRMKTERERVAALVRAKGAQAATVIQADADRERTVLLADAKSKALGLQGEGQAKATSILAKAYGQDPSFFKVWRTLEAYRKGLANSSTELLLSPESPLLRYLAVPPEPDSSTAAH